MEDISEDRLLKEALAARVIEELPQAVGWYQFTHALIQETLTEELTLTRRVRLHARIAETLEELYGDLAAGGRRDQGLGNFHVVGCDHSEVRSEFLPVYS